jgi:TPR repeat protein
MKTLSDWYRLVEQGDAGAQFNLGWMYDNGQGVVQDYKEAIKWYRLAAEQGLADAQYNLGAMYDMALGVLQDYKESVKWYRLAAEQGDAQAQYNLGVRYHNGEGVAQDYVMAHMYWNIAGAGGYKDAIKWRGIVEKKMTPSQIEKAQDLAREWMKKH